jgi:hypothetical protein
MRRDDGAEGQFEGTLSDAGLGEFRTVSFGSKIGEGETGAGNGGGELFTSPGTDSGRADSSGGDSATEPKRRGRPPGSKSAAAKSGRKPLSESALAAARRKLASSLAGGVGFGFSCYGVYRGNKYKKYSPILANHVYGCYQIPKEAADSIGEPLADAFIQWFPQYIEPVSKGIDPALALGRLISVLQQTSDNERQLVVAWQERMQQPHQHAPTNGAKPPEPETTPEGAFEGWMQEQTPQPEEVLMNPQTHIPTS